MKMSELCSKCRVTKDTVRYYHRTGLLKDAERNPENGYSIYTEAHVERLRYIKKLQSFGFLLKEIKSAIQLSESEEITDQIRVKTLEQKLAEVNTKLNDLHEYKASLEIAIKNLKGRM